MARSIIIPSETDPTGWGSVPTTDGDITTSVPVVDPVTGLVTSQTQTQQNATAGAAAVSQYTFLAPAPVQSPLMDSNGYMTTQWITWFNQLSRRVGGTQSTSVSDLDILTEFDDIPQTVRFPEKLDPYMEEGTRQGQILKQISDLTGETFWGPNSVNTNLYVKKSGDTMTGTLGVPNVQFNTTSPITTNTLGNTFWDIDSQTLSTIVDATNGVTLQHGQEVMIRCVNKTASIITDGQVVYVNDAQGNRPTAVLAKADNITTSMCIGVATQHIAINAEGFVTTIGLVHGYDTRAFTDGQKMYLSNVTAGLLTPTIPTSPSYLVMVATALNSTVNGSIFVHPEQPIALDLTLTADTDLASPSQKAVKAYLTGYVPTTHTTTTAVASATLTAGQWVNFHNVAGVKNARPADSTDATKPAQGFVLAGFASTATATVYLVGANTIIPVGAYAAADVGKPVFLSTSGGTTLTPPATTGNLLQQVGYVDAVGASYITVSFNLMPGIIRA